MDWNLLEEVLWFKGFHWQWIRWIMGWIWSFKYLVFINGHPCGETLATWWLRQVDPLHSFLFLIESEVFGFLLDIVYFKRADKQFSFGKEKICFCPSIIWWYIGRRSLLSKKLKWRREIGFARNVHSWTLQVTRNVCTVENFVQRENWIKENEWECPRVLLNFRGDMSWCKCNVERPKQEISCTRRNDGSHPGKDDLQGQ